MAEPRIPTQAERVLATPQDYEATFEGIKAGQKVLQDLCARFHDRTTYVAGGLEAQRETERRAAQKEVVTYILRKIGQLGEDENATS